MKTMRALFLVLFVFFVVSAAGAAGDLPAKVIRVIDGDTVEARLADTGIIERIRIIGLDTPELHHPRKPVEYYAQEAKERAELLLLGKSIKLRLDETNTVKGHRGRYRRLLAHVIFSQGAYFAESMILEGYAHAYLKYPFDPALMERFRDAEKQARQSGRGLWKQR